jgi:hypothetical protein
MVVSLKNHSFRMNRRMIRAVAVLALGLVMFPLVAPQFADAACPERPACRGCGCKGGPGYRGPDGRCVGFRQLQKICGNPPDLRCTFENAPGTGANQECALSPKAKTSVN